MVASCVYNLNKISCHQSKVFFYWIQCWSSETFGCWIYLLQENLDLTYNCTVQPYKRRSNYFKFLTAQITDRCIFFTSSMCGLDNVYFIITVWLWQRRVVCLAVSARRANPCSFTVTWQPFIIQTLRMKKPCHFDHLRED